MDNTDHNYHSCIYNNRDHIHTSILTIDMPNNFFFQIIYNIYIYILKMEFFQESLNKLHLDDRYSYFKIITIIDSLHKELHFQTKRSLAEQWNQNKLHRPRSFNTQISLYYNTELILNKYLMLFYMRSVDNFFK